MLIMSLYGLWGLSIMHSSEMNKLLRDDKKFDKLYDLITYMVWLRLICALLILFLIIMIFFFIIFAYILGQRDFSNRQKRIFNRLPLVN